MSETRRKRPWLAVFLAFIYPGLGHVYLREWLRAILWFGLVFSTTTLLIEESVMAPLEDGISVDALLTISGNIPLEASVVLFLITAFSMADAFYMATKGNTETEVAEGAKCPHCGKELEAELDFCHWCTTKLDQPVEDDE